MILILQHTPSFFLATCKKDHAQKDENTCWKLSTFKLAIHAKFCKVLDKELNGDSEAVQRGHETIENKPDFRLLWYCLSIGFQQFHRWLLNFLNIQATLAFFEKIFLVIFSWIWNFYLEKKT